MALHGLLLIAALQMIGTSGKGTLEGSIVHESGTPLKYAVVRIEGEPRRAEWGNSGDWSVAIISPFTRTCYIGDNGTFSINLDSGDYLLKCYSLFWDPFYSDTLESSITIFDDSVTQCRFVFQADNRDDIQTGALYGRITDTDGNPLVGAVVSLLNTDFTGMSDPNGMYIIHNIEPNVFDVQVQMVGMVDAFCYNVPIACDSISECNFASSDTSSNGLQAGWSGQPIIVVE